MAGKGSEAPEKWKKKKWGNSSLTRAGNLYCVFITKILKKLKSLTRTLNPYSAQNVIHLISSLYLPPDFLQ